MQLPCSQDVDYAILPDYIDFILQHHLEDFVEDNLKRAFEINLPILKVVAHLSREELFQFSMTEIKKYLESIKEGQALSIIREENEKWIKGEHKEIRKEEVSLADVIFAHNLRKQSMMQFVPLFTQDICVYRKLSFELEHFYNQIAEISYASFLKVQHESILKEKELSEKILNSSFQSVAALVAVRDEQNRIVDFEYLFANKESRSLRNWTSAEVAGKRLLQEFPGTEKEGLFEKYKSVVETGIPLEYEFFYPHEGISRWMKQSVVKWEDGIVITGIDITSLKRNKEELRKLNAQLEERVASRTKDLAESQQRLVEKNEELTRINNDLDNFIYTASHDLKAPISNIEGLIYGLKDAIDHDTKDEMEVILALIQKSILRFQNTLTDLTEISKVQKESLEDVGMNSIRKIVEDVQLSILNLIQETNAEIVTDFDSCTEIRFSKKNLKSIFYNLISNAIKYRNPSRRPAIRIKCEKHTDHTLISVSDNGLGFKMEHKEKIFSMFKRLHNHVEGTGIGLYIVKKIIDNAEGKIEVESEEGQGTTFRIYLKNSQE